LRIVMPAYGPMARLRSCSAGRALGGLLEHLVKVGLCSRIERELPNQAFRLHFGYRCRHPPSRRDSSPAINCNCQRQVPRPAELQQDRAGAGPATYLPLEKPELEEGASTVSKDYPLGAFVDGAFATASTEQFGKGGALGDIDHRDVE